MRTSLAAVLVVSLFVFLMWTQQAYAEDEYVGAYNYTDDAYYDAYEASNNTAAFDGGYGSTINTSADSYPVGDVPDVGEGVPVGYVDQDGNYHSY